MDTLQPIAPYGDAVRFNRALAKARVLAADFHKGGLEHLQGNVYKVRSASLSDIWYTATPATCSCLAWQSAPHTYDGVRTCKHTLALRLHLGEKINAMSEQIAQPAQQDVAPTPALLALHAIAAGIESLNQRTSNVEDSLAQITDLLASALAHLANAPEAPAETTPAPTPQPQRDEFGEPVPQRVQVYQQPPSTPSQYTSPNRIAVQATAICKGFDSRTNKPTVSVLCGEWNKFGVPVYPEVMPRLGFAGIDVLPLGPTPWDKDVIVEMREDGKPKKIVGLAN